MSVKFNPFTGNFDFVGGGSAVVPGGSDTQIQYNDGGAFGGVTNFTYNDSTGALGWSAASQPFLISGVNNASVDATFLRIDRSTSASTNHLDFIFPVSSGARLRLDLTVTGTTTTQFTMDGQSVVFDRYFRLSGNATSTQTGNRVGFVMATSNTGSASFVHMLASNDQKFSLFADRVNSSPTWPTNVFNIATDLSTAANRNFEVLFPMHISNAQNNTTRATVTIDATTSQTANLLNFTDTSDNVLSAVDVRGGWLNVAAPATDHLSSGSVISLTANENQAFGDAVYIDSDGEAHLADADAESTARVVGMCLDTVTTGNSAKYLLQGIARDDTWAWTVGGLIYLSTTGTTGNTLTQTAPSGSADAVVVVGVATHADRMYFNPSTQGIVEIA